MSSMMSEYVASIGFALNFEDHKDSAQVRAGESVFFDGKKAQYINRSGDEISGVAPSLRSAINMRWLNLKTNVGITTKQVQETQMIDRDADKIPANRGEKYDNLKGGSFEEMMAKERRMEGNIIHDDALIVKHTGSIAVKEKKAAAAGKLEISGDQVEIKENVMVNSSTTTAPNRSHKKEIIRSEDYGAKTTTPIKGASEQKNPETKKETFTVDDKTPRIPEDATMKEVKRAVVQNEGESQDAVVVGTVKKASMTVESPEGVVLKKKGETEKSETTKVIEGVTFKTVEKKAPPTNGATVTVSSGGDAITEVTEGAEGVEVVQKKTGVNIAPKPESTDYLSMLPEDWGSLHWTKKEKFVKNHTNVDFIKFILSVETTTAVQNACKARLKELGQEIPD